MDNKKKFDILFLLFCVGGILVVVNTEVLNQQETLGGIIAWVGSLLWLATFFFWGRVEEVSSKMRDERRSTDKR